MIHSATILGIDAIPIQIESDIAFGMPSFTIVGLPDASVRESRDRIRAAIKNSGLPFPRTRVTVNLAPADVKKQGPLFDLPIALAILIAQGEFDRQQFSDILVIGELALNGTIRPVKGILASALLAKRKGIRTLIVPKENAEEALQVSDIAVIAAENLASLSAHLRGERIITPSEPSAELPILPEHQMDFKDIKGQQLAKRGLEIAAAGGHNVLLKGPPGTGKTLLARALPSILPSLGRAESLEVTSIASVAGLLPEGGRGLVLTRPFRAPHHNCSAVSLVGGGAFPKPGEVTLAHRGVLFLDELAEFSRHTLEHLRQPLEDGFVTVARASATVEFPSRFMLIGAMNPCPCGHAQNPKRHCECSMRELTMYRKKISGPLLDRFDLIIDVPHLEAEEFLGRANAESSQSIRERVSAAREKQAVRLNAELRHSELADYCLLSPEAKELLEAALRSDRLSARGFARVKKVAKTISDLANSSLISAQHLAEALQFRPRDLFPSPR